MYRKLSEEEQYQVAHGAVSDTSRYRERLEATNFDKFLTALAKTVGGTQRQLYLIQMQLEIATKSLSPTRCVAAQIRRIYEKRKVLGESTENLVAIFCATYLDSETLAFERLKTPADVSQLQSLLSYLSSFWDLCKEVGWLDQKKTVIIHLKGLVRRQISIIFNEERFSRNLSWSPEEQEEQGMQEAQEEQGEQEPTRSLSWQCLSPEDWKVIIRSVLVSSCKKSFFQLFCQEKLLLESLQDKIVQKSRCYCVVNRTRKANASVRTRATLLAFVSKTTNWNH